MSDEQAKERLSGRDTIESGETANLRRSLKSTPGSSRIAGALSDRQRNADTWRSLKDNKKSKIKKGSKKSSK